MNFFVQRSELRALYDKVAAGERISEADALRLFESKDLNALGAIADLARQKKVGNRASYIVNRDLNYSNYCILSCQFCSFARKKRDSDGFELSIPQMVEKAREALKLGITELHIVGGLHPSVPFSYYTDMLKALSALNGSGTGVPPVPVAGGVFQGPRDDDTLRVNRNRSGTSPPRTRRSTPNTLRGWTPADPQPTRTELLRPREGLIVHTTTITSSIPFRAISGTTQRSAG